MKIVRIGVANANGTRVPIAIVKDNGMTSERWFIDGQWVAGDVETRGNGDAGTVMANGRHNVTGMRVVEAQMGNGQWENGVVSAEGRNRVRATEAGR